MKLSPAAVAILRAVPSSGIACFDDAQPLEITRIGWRRLREAGATQAILDELHHYCDVEGGVQLEREAPPAPWTVETLAHDGDRAQVALSKGDESLELWMPLREAQRLKVGAAVTVTVRPVKGNR